MENLGYNEIEGKAMSLEDYDNLGYKDQINDPFEDAFSTKKQNYEEDDFGSCRRFSKKKR